jgi:hypothetical protein
LGYQAGSPTGFEKSIGGRSPGSSSARTAASRPLLSGDGKVIGRAHDNENHENHS